MARFIDIAHINHEGNLILILYLQLRRHLLMSTPEKRPVIIDLLTMIRQIDHNRLPVTEIVHHVGNHIIIIPGRIIIIGQLLYLTGIQINR